MKSLIKMVAGIAMLVIMMLVKMYADMQKQTAKQQSIITPGMITIQDNDPMMKLISLQFNLMY